MTRYNSILFDVYRWVDHPEVKKLFDLLWGAIPRGGRQKKTFEKMAECLKLILCNLATSHYVGKPLAIPMRYSEFSSGRYSRLHIDRIPFLAVLDWLEGHGLIICRKGHKPKHEPGTYTRIWPGEELHRIFDEIDWAPERIIGDCIELKDEDKHLISFSESDVTKELRNHLETINSLYLKHYFTSKPISNKTYYYNNYYVGGKSEYEQILTQRNIEISRDTKSNRQILIPNTIHTLREPNEKPKRFVPQIKAVFNGGNFTTGGRFYANNLLGENWQTIPSEQRKSICIDGEPTVELDFDAFHINILYATSRIQLPPDFDPYVQVAGEAMRPLVKVLFLTAINAKSELAVKRAMDKKVHQLEREIHLSKRGLRFLELCQKNEPDWEKLITRLLKCHSPIRDYFCSGTGIFLQRIDSEIMRYIMLKLAGEDIPCLPVHDSAIVAEQHEDLLRAVMDETYREIMDGYSCGISKK